MAPSIAAVILAAGRSSRMGERHKLTEDLGGRPLVCWAVEAAMQSKADPVIVVLGHEADEVAARLPSTVLTVLNADFAEGLSSSLSTGIQALPDTVDGVVVLLGDMPGIGVELLDRMVDAWRPGIICVPTHNGLRGNPVLWDASFFPEISMLSGDRGARTLLTKHAGSVKEVDADESVLRDVDTPEDLDEARRRH